MNPGSRYIAIEILCQWEQKLLPVDQLMEKVLAGTILDDQRDRQLIKSLVYGVIRWRGYLDWVIAEYSSHPLKKMQSRTLQGLRIGLFQLLFLDRVPPSAAVNETVRALKDMKQPKWLTGFVNGILRNVARQKQAIPAPANSSSLPESARLSHPGWLIARWKKRYGPETATALCRENNREPALCLRVNSTLANTDKLLEILKKESISAEQCRHSASGIRLQDYHGSIQNIPGFTEGLFQVQDEAAQLVALLLGPLQKKSFYLDGCAGLGGKTSHLAEMLPPESRLLAVEPDSRRISKLQENLIRLRLDTSVTIVQDTLDSLLPDMKAKFAGILVDAPCSGLGVIRRHPDIRWNRSGDDLLRYQRIQTGLLNTAAQLLAPQGTLVYATCSTEPEENDAVIEKFLKENQEFIVSDCRQTLPENAAALVDSMGFFRTLPHPNNMDGFFAARLLKN